MLKLGLCLHDFYSPFFKFWSAFQVTTELWSVKTTCPYIENMFETYFKFSTCIFFLTPGSFPDYCLYFTESVGFILHKFWDIPNWINNYSISVYKFLSLLFTTHLFTANFSVEYCLPHHIHDNLIYTYVSLLKSQIFLAFDLVTCFFFGIMQCVCSQFNLSAMIIVLLSHLLNPAMDTLLPVFDRVWATSIKFNKIQFSIY